MSSAFRIKGGSGGTTVKLKSGGGLAFDANQEVYVSGSGTTFALDSQVFSFTGTTTPVVGAARWYPYADSIVKEFYASIEQAPTSTVTLQLKKNGVAVVGGLITINAGEFKSNVLNLNESCVSTDYLTVDVVSGNSGVNIFATVVTQSDNSAFISIPPATASSLGVVQVGSGVHVDANGIISVNAVTSVNGKTGNVTIPTGNTGYKGEGTVLPSHATIGDTFYKTGPSTALVGLQINTNTGLYPISDFGLDPLLVDCTYFFAASTSNLVTEPNRVNLAYIGDGVSPTVTVYIYNAAGAWINLGTTTAISDVSSNHRVGTLILDSTGVITQGSFYIVGATGTGLATLAYGNTAGALTITIDPSNATANIPFYNAFTAETVGSFFNSTTLDVNHTAAKGYYVYTSAGTWEVAGSATSGGGGGGTVTDVDTVNYVGEANYLPWYPCTIPTETLTTVTNVNADDESYKVVLPFTFYFNGTDYGNDLNGGVWVGSNSYITFGAPCTEYNLAYGDPISIPQVLNNGICFDAGDSGVNLITTTTKSEYSPSLSRTIITEFSINIELTSTRFGTTDRTISLIFRNNNTFGWNTIGKTWVSMNTTNSVPTGTAECTGFVVNGKYIPYFNIYADDSSNFKIPDVAGGNFKWLGYAPDGTIAVTTKEGWNDPAGIYLGKSDGWHLLTDRQAITDANFFTLEGDARKYIGEGQDFETIAEFAAYVNGLSVNTMSHNVRGIISTKGLVNIKEDIYFTNGPTHGAVIFEGQFGVGYTVVTDIVSVDPSTLTVILTDITDLYVGAPLAISAPFIGTDITAMGDFAYAFEGAMEVITIDPATKTVQLRFDAQQGITYNTYTGLSLDASFPKTTLYSDTGKGLVISTPLGNEWTDGIANLGFKNVSITVINRLSNVIFNDGIYLLGSALRVNYGSVSCWNNMYFDSTSSIDAFNNAYVYINNLHISNNAWGNNISIAAASNFGTYFLYMAKNTRLFNYVSQGSTALIENPPYVGNDPKGHGAGYGTYVFDTTPFLKDFSRFAVTAVD